MRFLIIGRRMAPSEPTLTVRVSSGASYTATPRRSSAPIFWTGRFDAASDGGPGAERGGAAQMLGGKKSACVLSLWVLCPLQCNGTQQAGQAGDGTGERA